MDKMGIRLKGMGREDQQGQEQAQMQKEPGLDLFKVKQVKAEKKH
jgi:hypothetical protein